MTLESKEEFDLPMCHYTKLPFDKDIKLNDWFKLTFSMQKGNWGGLSFLTKSTDVRQQVLKKFGRILN